MASLILIEPGCHSNPQQETYVGSIKIPVLMKSQPLAAIDKFEGRSGFIN